MSLLPFILQRARRHWQILITLGLGVFLATALLASGPILIDTVIELGLRRTLQSADPADAHLRLTSRTPTDPAAYEALDRQLQEALRGEFGPYLDRIVRSIGSNWMFPWSGGQLLSDQRVNVRFYDDIAEGVEFLAGGWPEGPGSQPDVIPAVVPDELAQLYALRVGDRLPLSFRQDAGAAEAWIEVTGIVRPRNARDPYWFGDFSPLTSYVTSRWSTQYGAIVPRDAFFPSVMALFSDSVDVDVAWHVLLSHDAITDDDILPLRTRVAELNAHLKTFESRVLLQSGLDDILAKFQTQSQTIRAPLYILIAEVVLLALYYVTMVAALSMQEVQREFAVLRSRGASGWQITKIQLIEAGLIVVVAFLSGPVLGSALVRALVWIGPLADLGQSGWALGWSQSAWLAAGTGTLACLTGLLLPLGSALRRSIVTHQQTSSRASRPPWWQRYYLDVFLLLAGLILLWRLQLYGDLLAGGAGGPRVDWLLLLSPLALLLGSATILLRIFPLILRAMAALAARARGLSGVLAMWQASRNPTHVARLVLLLTLAIALGILSTGLNATLDQSESERSRYVAGNDVRLYSKRFIPLADLEATSGVLAAAGTWRGQGTVNLTSNRRLPRFDLLAIEPYSFAEVTTYRDDFAGPYMGELLGRLVAQERERLPALPLPGQPANLGLWLRASVSDKELEPLRRYVDGTSDAERVGLQAKLQTAQGELFTVRFDQVQRNQQAEQQTDRFVLNLSLDGRATELRFHIEPFDDGWRYFETALPALPTNSYPLRLHSLWVQNRAKSFDRLLNRIRMNLTLDDLTALDGETREPVVVEGFEDPTRIWYLDHSRMTARFTKLEPHSGRGALALELNYGNVLQVVSLKLTEGRKPDPLPALVSPAFLETTELQIGQVLQAWVNSIAVDFEIVGAVQYFPTLYEELEAGFLVTSRDLLLPLLNGAARQSVNLNEALLETDARVSADTLATMIPTLTESWEAEEVRKTLKANPLALGLRGVTFFGYSLTTLLSLVGFATHFYMSARQRETSYGVMRAMGLSPRQLYGSMVLEQVIFILAGLALGTALGILLNQITLPRLPVALGDRPPVPPFHPQEDWLAIGRVYLILALAFLISLGVATVLLWRTKIHRILRIGQE